MDHAGCFLRDGRVLREEVCERCAYAADIQVFVDAQHFLDDGILQTVPGADILANICRIHACSADWLLGIDKSRTALSVIGNGNAVAQGTGAKAVAIGTANFVEPTTALQVIDFIGTYMDRHGFKTVAELSGALDE